MKKMGYYCSTPSSLETERRFEPKARLVWEKISMDRILGQEYELHILTG